MTPLRQVRLLSNLRQADVAAAAGVARQTISLLEAGSRSPHLTTAVAIASALGCDVGGLWPELFDPAGENGGRRGGPPESAAPESAVQDVDRG